MKKGLLLGFDIGSSSVKAAVIDGESGILVAHATSPETEMAIDSSVEGWAEQDPELWWSHICQCCKKLTSQGVDLHAVKAIGIAYQMHGLVCLNKKHELVRPAIIWCDSRAVSIGKEAFENLGAESCFFHLLNAPGNFTASKLKWVQIHEPDRYEMIDNIMLPGDYIAFKLTGEVSTTPAGLSEGALWDFPTEKPASVLLEHFTIDKSLIPPVINNFGVQGKVSKDGATQTGLSVGIPVSYRGGDQPNNALSLNVLNPGDTAATAGTSGVVYGVTDKPIYDSQSRVNTFVHVNHQPEAPRHGVLMCINGTGILNSWIKNNLINEQYSTLNDMARSTQPGADGLLILPYGNGAERTLGNRCPGAAVHNLHFNRHGRGHFLRAAQEGIAYALAHGFEMLHTLGLQTSIIRAGKANMFLSPLFCEAFASVTGATIELYNTDGAQGAARGAGFGAGIYSSLRDTLNTLQIVDTIEPNIKCEENYRQAFSSWSELLEQYLSERK